MHTCVHIIYYIHVQDAMHIIATCSYVFKFNIVYVSVCKLINYMYTVNNEKLAELKLANLPKNS